MKGGLIEMTYKDIKMGSSGMFDMQNNEHLRQYTRGLSIDFSTYNPHSSNASIYLDRDQLKRVNRGMIAHVADYCDFHDSYEFPPARVMQFSDSSMDLWIINDKILDNLSSDFRSIFNDSLEMQGLDLSMESREIKW